MPLFCPHLEGATNDGVDCVGAGSDEDGDKDDVYGDLANDNGDNDDVYGDLVYNDNDDLVDDNGDSVNDNGDLSVSFQSTHPQVDSTTRLTAESSNLEKSLIVILIVISSPSKFES